MKKLAELAKQHPDVVFERDGVTVKAGGDSGGNGGANEWDEVLTNGKDAQVR